MSIAPISPIGAALRVQLAAAVQEALANGITVTPDGQAARAAQTQTAETQTAQAQTPTARAAETQASGATGPATSPAPQPQNPVRQAVVDSRAATAVRQGAVGPLFSDLAEALSSQGATTPALSAAIRQAMTQVLALQLPTSEPVTSQSLRQAVAQSGLFLEARLAAAPADAEPLPDLKAALLTLRQALATLTPSAAPAAPSATPAPLPSAPPPAAPPSSPVTIPTTGAAPETPPPTAPQAPSPAPAPTVPTPTTTADATRVVSQPSLLLTAQAAQAGAASEAAQPATAQPQPASAMTPAPQPAATPAVADQIQPPPGPVPTVPTRSPALALAILQETAEPAPPQAAQQTAQQLVPQAALAAQGAIPSALDITRTVSQSSLLLAAQAAATPEDPEPPLDARMPPARDAVLPVARVQAVAPAPPVRDAALEGQAPAPSTLREADDGPAVLQRLRQEVDQALARQTLHQLASVPKGSPAEGAAAWMFEIPIATPQGTAIAQFEIDRDGQRSGAEPGVEGWRARFSIDVEPLGPVHVHMSLKDGRAAVTVYAEREDSLARLREQGDDLARDLAGEVVFHPGAPRRPVPASGHFVDRIS